jgi:1-acyl-sn-glycerol-3-phosphate acyltransferase
MPARSPAGVLLGALPRSVRIGSLARVAGLLRAVVSLVRRTGAGPDGGRGGPPAASGRLPDDFGLDPELVGRIRPLAELLFRNYFRVAVSGLSNVPARGRALLVANHAGTIAFDAAMISTAILTMHARPRTVRWLFLDVFSRVPFVSTLLARTGSVRACPENGERLLEADELVGVFPEGVKGGGKLFRDRYRLARFGRGGFVRMAMRTGTPIIPVSVVGSEEIYPALSRLEWLARPLGLPMIPLTPTFPWLGPLGLIPLPSKWSIHFGRPLRFKPAARRRADEYLLVSLLTERVRRTIQTQVDRQLARRRSVFLG